jgi:hypothetical protein
MFRLRNRRRQSWSEKAEVAPDAAVDEASRCSMPPARACAMPAIELPISSGGPLAETLGRFRFNPLGYVMFAQAWHGAGRRRRARALVARHQSMAGTVH